MICQAIGTTGRDYRHHDRCATIPCTAWHELRNSRPSLSPPCMPGEAAHRHGKIRDRAILLSVMCVASSLLLGGQLWSGLPAAGGAAGLTLHLRGRRPAVGGTAGLALRLGGGGPAVGGAGWLALKDSTFSGRCTVRIPGCTPFQRPALVCRARAEEPPEAP